MRAKSTVTVTHLVYKDTIYRRLLRMRAKSNEKPSSSNLFLFFETSLCIMDTDPFAGGSETSRP